MPPLRDRKDDIPLMVSSFLKEFAKENGKNITSIDSHARAALYKYDWPGNIRQLRNCMESAVVMCGGDTLTLDDFPPTISQHNSQDVVQIPVGLTLDAAEKMYIQETLAVNRGNKSKTADVLGIGRKTLHRKLQDDEADSDDSDNE